MKINTVLQALTGLASVAVLILGVSTAGATAGSLAQERLDREINSPAVSFATAEPAAPADPDRAPGSIAQARLDREITSPVPLFLGVGNLLTLAVGAVTSGNVNNSVK
ncbi:MAG: hypothetical protein HYY65_00660 [Candidatus Tectomicrobia bacterium]|uniref:Secreted protein n=1 Tax=Tectimicrobiota bacterium TaxID=2528274 RepID=A0A932GLZ4_UNCTE|nr:hypothetical protein [Candidatus Tectomicrobia bacterium]